MDRHRADKRRKPQRSLFGSVYALAFAAILVLYVIFVVKVNYYATTTAATANGIGAAPAAREFGKTGRQMAEEGGALQNAPEPALAQAATRVVTPLRPEMKKPTRQPAIQVGAITKQPTHIPSREMEATTKPTAVPESDVLEVTAPPPMLKREEAAPAPVVKSNDTPQPVPAPVVDSNKTPQPLDMPAAIPETMPPTTAALVPTDAPVVSVAGGAVVYDEKDALGDRHVTLSGYTQTMNYLDAYKAVPGESLFLYFTCSDKHFNAYDWTSECTDASKVVYAAFAKSPSTNRLVTIYAGSENFWKYQNKFRNDRDLRIKAVPSIMKWHGNGGETSGMMITDTLTEEPFLRYLFKNTDQPDIFLNAAAMVETKTIETVSSHEAYRAKLAEYQLEAKPRRPLYLLFVSGRLAENNRPWCPYCRFSELPLKYGFYAFAPPNARLLRVEVAQTYQQWKTPNKFNQDQTLGPLRGVPGFYTVQELTSQELKMERIFERFDRIAPLKALFATAARVRDE